jgi:hypothetical protein
MFEIFLIAGALTLWTILVAFGGLLLGYTVKQREIQEAEAAKRKAER